LDSLATSGDNLSEQALATAQWGKPQDNIRMSYKPGAVWFGRAADHAETPVGFEDDRHALIVAGSRSGKGTSAIVPNLCMWPGSLVVIDPKGENASITARRRSNGSDFSDGLEQRTFVLDPFGASKGIDDLRAAFNPLDVLDPNNDEAVDDAGRIADALVINQANSEDPFFDEQARTLIKGLILHVLTSDDFAGKRNLVTVRRLITSGDVATRRLLEDIGDQSIPSSFELLFAGMSRNQAFHGIISGCGETFGSMAASSHKTLTSVLATAANHTEFIDSLPMQRLLSDTTPGFALAHLKTDPMGVSLFLSLPQRFMNTHFRWLRMMTSLIVTEMEKTPGPPAAGNPILMVLDEFAGLRKMDIIENAAAQIAGFGVKLCFIVQGLTQLKNVYKDNWEIFVGNAGAKIFFGIDDKFTRDYLSKYLGETEVIRKTRNASETRGTSRSETVGSSISRSSSTSSTSGGSSGTSYTTGSSTNSDIGLFWNSAKSTSSNNSMTFSSGSNWSSSSSQSASFSDNHSVTEGQNESRTVGNAEGIHKRALLTPDEIGLLFSRVDDKDNPAYPGLALALASGQRPLIVRRTNYYEDRLFERTFDPHPDHGFIPLPPPIPKSVLPPPLPKKVSQRDQLEAKYGAPHTQKAYEIVSMLGHDYPLLGLLSEGPDQLAAKILASSVQSIKVAAEDGRAHTMSETMEMMARILGPWLTTNSPNAFPGVLAINYSDEHLGKAAVKRKGDRDSKLGMLLIGGLATVFVVTLGWSGNIWVAVIATIVALFVVAGVVNN